MCGTNRTLFPVFCIPDTRVFALGSIKQNDLFDDIDQDTCGNEKTERAHHRRESSKIKDTNFEMSQILSPLLSTRENGLLIRLLSFDCSVSLLFKYFFSSLLLICFVIRYRI